MLEVPRRRAGVGDVWGGGGSYIQMHFLGLILFEIPELRLKVKQSEWICARRNGYIQKFYARDSLGLGPVRSILPGK